MLLSFGKGCQEGNTKLDLTCWKGKVWKVQIFFGISVWIASKLHVGERKIVKYKQLMKTNMQIKLSSNWDLHLPTIWFEQDSFQFTFRHIYFDRMILKYVSLLFWSTENRSSSWKEAWRPFMKFLWMGCCCQVLILKQFFLWASGLSCYIINWRTDWVCNLFFHSSE